MALGDSAAQGLGATNFEEGYVPRNAAALRSRKTHSVGIIEANIKNAFFSAMSVGVEKELDKAGMAILWANAAERVEKQARAIEVMLEYGVDGLLICPAAGTRREDLEIKIGHIDGNVL